MKVLKDGYSRGKGKGFRDKYCLDYSNLGLRNIDIWEVVKNSKIKKKCISSQCQTEFLVAAQRDFREEATGIVHEDLFNMNNLQLRKFPVSLSIFHFELQIIY